MVMNATRVSLLAGIVLAVATQAGPSFAARASAARASSYDGSWSVSVITDSGSCDRAYRYRIKISNGALSYDQPNGPAINVSGHVNKRGQIDVTVGWEDRKAAGTGRLSGNSGAGRWSGKSSTEQCSGRWEAERRE